MIWILGPSKLAVCRPPFLDEESFQICTLNLLQPGGYFMYCDVLHTDLLHSARPDPTRPDPTRPAQCTYVFLYGSQKNLFISLYKIN